MKCSNGGACKLKACSLGVAIGVAYAVFMFVLAWGAWQFEYASGAVEIIGTVYPGFEASLIGGLWGALWGFIDGFIFGLIIAWVYNLCGRCCCKSK